MTAIDDQLRAYWDPPPDAPTVMEFAQTLKVPDGPYRGDRYDPSLEAPQLVVCQAFDGAYLNAIGEPFRDFVICWCTQAGKSLATVLVPTLHSVVGCRESVVYCLPTGDLLNKVWTDKLKPSIDGAGLGSWLPEKGPGSRGGRPSALPFRDPETHERAGSIIFVAGGSGKKREAGQAGVTAKVVVADEADEYEDAHRLALVRQRAAAFGSEAVFVEASTVKKDTDSVILADYHASTASRIWYACPHCGAYQAMEWEQVTYGGEDAIDVIESARYTCAHCAVGLTEDERRTMLADWRLVHEGQSVDDDGKVVGPVPRTRVFGLLCSKLDFGIGISMPELAEEHWRAQKRIYEVGDHGLMRSFMRDRLSRMYTGDLDDEDADAEFCTVDYLEKRSRKGWAAALEGKGDGYSWHIAESLPEGITKTAIGADIQGDRIYWAHVGLGPHGHTFDLGWGYEYIVKIGDKLAPFGKGDVAVILDRIAAMEELLCVPDVRVVDTGFDPAEDELSTYLMQNKSKWRGIRGVKTLPKSDRVHEPGLLGWDNKWRPGLGRFDICTALAHQRVHQAYLRRPDAAGGAYLPKGLRRHDAFVRHLCAWQWVDGKWKQMQRRDDHLDCRVYATSQLLWAKLEKPRAGRKYGVVGSNQS